MMKKLLSNRIAGRLLLAQLATASLLTNIVSSDANDIAGNSSPALNSIQTPTASQDRFINLAHLDHLVQAAVIDGDSMAFAWLYSSFPDYARQGDPDEGIAAVDDAARVVIVYLKHFRQWREAHSLHQARLLLKFILRMQASDGGFYNFIWPDYSINTAGQTSNNNAFNFWAARALWAMGFAFHTFNQAGIEPELQNTLQQRLQRALAKMSRSILNYNRFQTRYGFTIPANLWLINEGADLSSEAALGLAYYYEASRDNFAKSLLEKLCDGLAAYQLGEADEFPFGAHLAAVPNLHLWHAWGSRQTQALALAGRLLNRADWIASARREADNFFLHLLTAKLLHSMTPAPVEFSQINYGTSVIVSGFNELYHATGKIKYAQYAGLMASWWLGNNVAGFAMYDSATGRCFDGIDPANVNRNSGAESVAEGLMALQDVTCNLAARSFMHYKAVADNRFQIFEAERGQILTGNPETVSSASFGDAAISNGQYLKLAAGDAMRLNVQVTNPFAELRQYFIYVQFIKQPVREEAAALRLTIAGGEMRVHRQGGAASPSPFIWIEKAGAPIELASGDHLIALAFAGTDPTLKASVDYVMLMPVTARKVFANTPGDTITVERNLLLTPVESRDGRRARQEIPVQFKLHPNPSFNAATHFYYELSGERAKPESVILQIYNLLGQKVRTLVDEKQRSGAYQILWDGKDELGREVYAGIYFARLQIGSAIEMQKITIFR